MAGTVTMVSIRSASMACRNAPTSKTGMTTAVPPTYRATSSWLLQPVTWNSGTEIRVRRPAGSTQRPRRQVAALDAQAAQAACHARRAVPQRGVAQPRAAAGLHHRLGGAVLVDRVADHLHQVAGQAFVALDAVLAADDAGHVEHAAQVAVVLH